MFLGHFGAAIVLGGLVLSHWVLDVMPPPSPAAVAWTGMAA